MTNSRKNKRHWMVAIFFALIFVLAIPAASFAQGRGNNRGRGRDMSWKCRVFVNCHDARDGRWDNRGPRGSRIGRGIGRGNRNVISFPRNRVRVDRDGDGDFDRNDRLLNRRQNRIERHESREMRRHGRGNR